MSLMLFLYKVEISEIIVSKYFLILKVSEREYNNRVFYTKTSQKIIILKQNYKISLKNYICIVEYV